MATPIFSPEAAESVRQRTVRMSALVDLAGTVYRSDDPAPAGAGEATDGNDKLQALLRALQNELEELHAEVSHV
jgi:hypothetical protein